MYCSAPSLISTAVRVVFYTSQLHLCLVLDTYVNSFSVFVEFGFRIHNIRRGETKIY